MKKAFELEGLTKTRQVYEKAILDLDVDGSRKMCMRFAELEMKLKEIDRARAIYRQCSQMCDPRVSAIRTRYVPAFVNRTYDPYLRNIFVYAKLGDSRILGGLD